MTDNWKIFLGLIMVLVCFFGVFAIPYYFSATWFAIPLIFTDLFGLLVGLFLFVNGLDPYG